MDKSGLGVYETAGVDVDPGRRHPPADRRSVLGPGDRDGHGPDRRRRAGRPRRPDRGLPRRHRSDPGRGRLVVEPLDCDRRQRGAQGGRGDQEEGARASPPSCSRRPPGDLVLDEGVVHVTRLGRRRGSSLGEIAAACDTVSSERRGESPGLGAREIYEDPMMNYPYGVALCQLEIDPATGADRRPAATSSPTRRARRQPDAARGTDRRRRRPGPRAGPSSRSSTTTRRASRSRPRSWTTCCREPPRRPPSSAT